MREILAAKVGCLENAAPDDRVAQIDTTERHAAVVGVVAPASDAPDRLALVKFAQSSRAAEKFAPLKSGSTKLDSKRSADARSASCSR